VPPARLRAAGASCRHLPRARRRPLRLHQGHPRTPACRRAAARKAPEWIGRFVFVQVAAPSRRLLEEYQTFQERIARVTERINKRFGRPDYLPIHLLAQHHEHDAVTELFRACDVCVVTSLHDGMNLVCKEFVAARDDEQGALISAASPARRAR
jgi:trehalose-6-phosphate synthase